MNDVPSATPAGSRGRPHVLLVHCHDLGRHLGCYDNPTVVSPHLDRLAGDGVRCTSMSAAAPQCSPSRAALFTGRWPHANGVLGLTHDHFGWDLHPAERHLGGLLAEAGYATELVGMHHESRRRPDDELAARLGFDRVRTGGLVDEVAARGEETVARLAAGDRPFYLQLGFTEPHRLPGSRDPEGVMGFLGDHLEPDTERGVAVPPWLVDDAGARTEVAELQGAIRAMDAGVGRVLAALGASGVADDTVTIFTTDHGLALPRAKCSLYEPGLAVAFLVRWPAGGWTGGRQVDAPLANVDVVPTLLDLLGLDPAGPQRHGISFRGLLDGGPAVRERVYGEMTYHDYYDPRRSVRDRRWKLIANFSSAPAFMDPSQGTVRRCTAAPTDHPWTTYHPPVELYDLLEDPLEVHDRADDPDCREERDRLAAALRDWMAATGDPLLDGAVTSPLHRETAAVLDG
ncbi:arylsulfatase A-like enzyme [Friedmanniella endophytica]|uniref:Arylsulfatase A-like enzyme n=1 Tax=Microlunatus kandeliicorticis TaxID=1759536 RepID=A0A7W3IQ21_9ACTN|nr:sulfatase [Microlunatus kandeliicorticis]MBA8793119.1 arylsulfatase A-like enzyme [Microlunatus kandeliicorticis]